MLLNVAKVVLVLCSVLLSFSAIKLTIAVGDHYTHIWFNTNLQQNVVVGSDFTLSCERKCGTRLNPENSGGLWIVIVQTKERVYYRYTLQSDFQSMDFNDKTQGSMYILSTDTQCSDEQFIEYSLNIFNATENLNGTKIICGAKMTDPINDTTLYWYASHWVEILITQNTSQNTTENCNAKLKTCLEVSLPETQEMLKKCVESSTASGNTAEKVSLIFGWLFAGLIITIIVILSIVICRTRKKTAAAPQKEKIQKSPAPQKAAKS